MTKIRFITIFFSMLFSFFGMAFDHSNLINDYQSIDLLNESETPWQRINDDNIIFNHKLSSLFEYKSSSGKIALYNTGIKLEAKHKSGFSVNSTTTIDGYINELDSKNFDLDNFIKEFKANYEFELEHAVLLLTVGKMTTGTKTDQSSPKALGGVMGVRLSISPKKIPLVQEWLDKHQLKVSKIEITRYDSASKNRFDFNDLSTMDMTAYALYLSCGRRLHTFFIYKRPDEDSYAPESFTMGAIYSMDAPLSPRFFVLNSSNKSSFMDLNILVLSASIEIFEETRAKLSWSYVDESMHDTQKNIFDTSFERNFGEIYRTKVKGVLGVKFQNSNSSDPKENETVFYLQFQVEF